MGRGKGPLRREKDRGNLDELLTEIFEEIKKTEKENPSPVKERKKGGPCHENASEPIIRGEGGKGVQLKMKEKKGNSHQKDEVKPSRPS